MFRHLIGNCLLVAALAAVTGTSWARNDKLLLPIEPALRSAGTRQVLAPEIAMRFGSASAAGTDGSAAVIEAHAVADPYGSSSVNNPGNFRQRRTDDQICLDAFRRALVDLQQRARAHGAAAVVGIVSNYNRVVLDSREVYECRIGHTRGVVDLQGRISRTVPSAAAPAITPAPPPRLAAAPAAAAPDPAPAQPPRIASGFAAIDDVDAIPYLSDRGRNAYREWLALPTPKAFALSATGFFFATSGLKPKDTTMPTEPNDRALLGCERNAKVPCKLYAVNGSVVWVKEPR